MPFMIKTDAILRPGKERTTFGNSQITIQCATTDRITMASPITIIDQPEDHTALSDDYDNYYDIVPRDIDSERLQHLDTIRRTTLAIETQQQSTHDYTYKMQIPNFQKEFPSVFRRKYQQHYHYCEKDSTTGLHLKSQSSETMEMKIAQSLKAR